MGEAKRRKMAGQYPDQTKEHQAARMPKYRRRYFGMMKVAGRLMLPGTTACYQRVKGSLRRLS